MPGPIPIWIAFCWRWRDHRLWPVTISALRFGRLLGEAVIVETIFAWPGIGRWMVEAIQDRDYPAIQGFVLYIATIFVLINVAVDVSYRVLDPRVRSGSLAVPAR